MEKIQKANASLDLLKKWQKNECITPVTVSDALEGDQLSVIKKEHEDMLNVVLMKLFTDALSTRLNMGDNELKMIVNDVKKDYFYLKVPEVAMVLRKGIQGKYGNVPAGANPVYYWFHQYDTVERIDYFQTEAQKHKEPYEKQTQEMKRADAAEFDKAYKNQVKYLKAKKKAHEVSGK